MATTTNYGWTTPDNTDAVANGALAIRTLGSAIDTTLKTVSNASRANWRSGRTYRNGAYNSGTYSASPTSTVVAYVPFYVPNTVTLASISAQVATSGTATSGFAIYNSSSTTFRPTTLVVNVGTFSASTTGIKTVSTTQVLNAGLYWIALRINNTSVAVRAAAPDLTDEFFLGQDSITNALSRTSASACYEAVDASFPSADATGLTYSVSSSAPLIAVTVA